MLDAAQRWMSLEDDDDVRLVLQMDTHGDIVEGGGHYGDGEIHSDGEEDYHRGDLAGLAAPPSFAQVAELPRHGRWRPSHFGITRQKKHTLRLDPDSHGCLAVVTMRSGRRSPGMKCSCS